MPMTARAMIHGANVCDEPGKSSRQNRSIANVPTLSTTDIISTAVAGVDCTAASGSHEWNGHNGALIANANMKPRNSAFRTIGSTPSPPDDAASAIARRSNVPPSNGPSGRAVTT